MGNNEAKVWITAMLCITAILVSLIWVGLADEVANVVLPSEDVATSG